MYNVLLLLIKFFYFIFRTKISKKGFSKNKTLIYPYLISQQNDHYLIK